MAGAPHMLKNMHIKTGYRVFKSKRASVVGTVFGLNNETLNVYTIVAAGVAPLAVVAANAVAAPAFFTTPGFHPYLFLAALAFALANCVCTMAYHTFCQIPAEYHLWSAVDLFGIGLALVAFGLGLMSTDYAYPLLPRPVGLGALLFAVGSTAWAYAVARHRVRIGRESPVGLLVLNVAIGVCVTLPCYLALRGGHVRATATAALLIGGMLLYLFKIPERFACARSPSLDLCGNSHQIWHVMYCLAFYTFFTDILSHSLPGTVWFRVVS